MVHSIHLGLIILALYHIVILECLPLLNFLIALEGRFLYCRMFVIILFLVTLICKHFVFQKHRFYLFLRQGIEKFGGPHQSL